MIFNVINHFKILLISILGTKMMIHSKMHSAMIQESIDREYTLAHHQQIR